ncbi:MAG: 2-hydroxyacid dehydrogenase [Rhodospirillales bacterium]|nr:2-hydroxyacid dehydrogenase [Rhodospirillales bacterium]
MMHPARADKLRALLPQGMTLIHATERSEAHRCAIIAEADYAITGQVAVSGTVLRAARRLKLLHKWGVGVDNIDLETARACGIAVARTAGSNATAVAEHTVGLMLAALRNIGFGHAELREGRWAGGRMPQEARLLSGKTVGIVGFGAIGRSVARLLGGFGCTILYNKPTPLPAAEEGALGVAFATLAEMLPRVDVLSLHCPLVEATTRLIDAAALAAMKPGSVLVNVSRGGVVDEAALVEALRHGIIHAAAVDVYEIEPVPADHPLLGLPNAVVTPHLAAGAADNFVPTVTRMFDNMRRYGRGEPIRAGDRVV